MQPNQIPASGDNIPKRTVKDYLNMFYLLTGNAKIYELAPLFEAKKMSAYNMLNKLHQSGYIDDKRFDILKNMPFDNFKDNFFANSSEQDEKHNENRSSRYKMSEDELIKVLNFVKLIRDKDKN